MKKKAITKEEWLAEYKKYEGCKKAMPLECVNHYVCKECPYDYRNDLMQKAYELLTEGEADV